MADARVILGDCKQILLTLESESFDSLVTDPPAGISFMGKAWDSYESLQHFQEDLTVVFKEALRVMKPGAHGLVWALPRTSGFTMMALVNAGFEVRDSIVHLFGSGMPKGLNVAKAGAGPEWEGWNTTLKPAHEIWWLVRKPLSEKTVVKQVLETGTGAINIDACRIGSGADKGVWPVTTRGFNRQALNSAADGSFRKAVETDTTTGRWPANVVLSHAEDCGDGGECSDECAVQALDEQSGFLVGAGNKKPIERPGDRNKISYDGGFGAWTENPNYYPGGGGASRFFYTSKVSPHERKLPDGSQNRHPTAKSVKLMRYFTRLITPTKGTILDPFAGSGTTGVAALLESFNFVGIELDPEHHRVAQLRLDATQQQISQEETAREFLGEEP